MLSNDLIRLIKTGKVDELERFLDVNHDTDFNWAFVFIVAVTENKPAVVSLILCSKYSARMRYLPLSCCRKEFIHAAESGNLNMMLAIYLSDIPLFTERSQPECLLESVVRKGFLPIVSFLLNLRDLKIVLLSENNRVVIKSKIDYTVLNQGAFCDAVAKGYTDVVETLLSLDNPKIEYAASNNAPLCSAAEFGHLDILDKLLRFRTSHPRLALIPVVLARYNLALVGRPSYSDPGYVLDYTVNNNSPFRLAAQNGHLDVVNRLLEQVNPKVDYTAKAEEAFRYAAANGHLSVVKRLLLLDSPKVNYSTKNEWALRHAAKAGQVAVVALLLTLPGVNPMVDNFQALQLAAAGCKLGEGLVGTVGSVASSGHTEVVELLVRWASLHGYCHVVDKIVREHPTRLRYKGAVDIQHLMLQSVSDAATVLNRYYGHLAARDLHTNLIALKKDIKQLGSNDKHTGSNALNKDLKKMIAPAMRYLEDIVEPPDNSRFCYQDRFSGLSTQRVIVLVYLAGLDDTRRTPGVSKEDALILMLRGFCEAQRGPGLNNHDFFDSPVCESEGFKLALFSLSGGIHPFGNIKLITSSQLSLKLPIIVKDAIFSDLACYSRPKSPEAYLFAVELNHKMHLYGVEAIYEHIKEKVAERVLDEFGELFGDHDTHPDFVELMASVKSVELPNTKLEEQLTQVRQYYRNFRIAQRPQDYIGAFDADLNKTVTFSAEIELRPLVGEVRPKRP